MSITFDELFNSPDFLATKVDPIALSVRCRKLGYNYLVQGIVSQVTSDDLQEANAIRQYYDKKYTWRSLKKPLTKYRQTTLNLVRNNNPKTINNDHYGIITKLPYFFQEDKLHDFLKKHYIVDQMIFRERDQVVTNTVKELTFLTSIETWSNKYSAIRLWFADDDKFLYRISASTKNELLACFSNLFVPGKRVKFKTNYSKCKIEDLRFYNLYDFTFLKEDICLI